LKRVYSEEKRKRRIVRKRLGRKRVEKLIEKHYTYQPKLSKSKKNQR
jgi:hypothetical protein